MIQKIAERSVKPKIRLKVTQDYKFVNDVVQKNKLHTVCEEARCPNMYECWDRGTATIMILGDTCTRACGFCAVKTGKPSWNDSLEPYSCLLYTSPSPRDWTISRMPSSA